MQPQFRFPRSTVFLMLVIFAGVVLTIAKASSIAGDTSGGVWPSLMSVMVLMVLGMCAAARGCRGYSAHAAPGWECIDWRTCRGRLLRWILAARNFEETPCYLEFSHRRSLGVYRKSRGMSLPCMPP